MNEYFEFPAKLKKILFGLMAIGVISLIAGIAGGLGGTRIWASVLINGFFFFAIALAATFFMAVQYAAESGWTAILKRIFESISSYLPIGAIFLFLVFIGGAMHWHHIYHWMDASLYDPASEHFDAIIAGKQAYLNQPFFWARAIIFIGVWIFFARRFRARSIEEDTIGGSTLHYKNVRDAAIFLVFFGFTSTVAAWDWIMSIDTHWFSTLFGWYIFSGMWITGMVTITFLALYLNRMGYLPQLNRSHIHDLGKWIFATSFLWSYLFFSQFMLIWYSNIPEEVTYFLVRIEDYKLIFWGMFIVNFVFPMLILMDKDQKKNPLAIVIIGSIVMIGHWVDIFLLVTPGSLKDGGVIGLFEVGLFIGFLGLFVFVVLNTLTKAPVVVKSHPFLEESVHHHIN
jgi:hypothetical protein